MSCTWMSLEIVPFKFTNTKASLSLPFRKSQNWLKTTLNGWTTPISALHTIFFCCFHLLFLWCSLWQSLNANAALKISSYTYLFMSPRNINPTNDVMQKKRIIYIVLWLLCSAALCHGGPESFMEMQGHFHLFFTLTDVTHCWLQCGEATTQTKVKAVVRRRLKCSYKVLPSEGSNCWLSSEGIWLEGGCLCWCIQILSVCIFFARTLLKPHPAELQREPKQKQ